MNKISLLIVILTALHNPFCICNNVDYHYHPVDDSSKIIEKVYLHSDRDSYFAGDDIWFKAYLIDASYNLLTNHSNNLHVELISPASKIINSRLVRINEGLGHGDLRLSENLISGRYRLRAYTNYMRNFEDQLFFNKDITIINSSDTGKVLSDSIKYIINKLEISFFPEGGSLVDNICSVIAFKAIDAQGAGCDVTGEIYSSTGEIITTFKSTHLGMGTFTLKPVSGLKYYAIVKNLTGDIIKCEIPGSFPTGVVLNISKTISSVLITINTNAETLPMVLKNDLSITISAHNITLKTIIFRMKSLTNKLILPIIDLPEGIVMLTLTGLDNLPLCERLVYLQNNEDVNVKIETNKSEYKLRDSVSVKISVSGASGIAQEAFLSLSAGENTSATNPSQFPSTISSWFLLESDIRGPLEEPSYYFDHSNPKRCEDLDLLLLTQGWRDFGWKYTNTNYPPETGFTVSGRLRKFFTNVPIQNSKVNVVILNNQNTLISTVPTDTSGRFRLEGIDITGGARLIVSAIGEKEHLQGLLLLDSLKYLPAKVQENMVQPKLLLKDNQVIKENIKALIREKEIKKTIRKKYTLSDTIALDEVKIIAKRPEELLPPHVISSRLLYNIPDNELIITTQLQSYKNAFQVMSGKIPGVHVGQVNYLNDDSGVRIRGALGQPLYMLDGMIVPWDEINSLPVSVIDRIDVLKTAASASALGVRGGNGVISYITKIGGSSTPIPVNYSVNIGFSGYDEARIFYSPEHSSSLESDYKPDLRTTLLWKPYITVKSNKDYFLNYFNADNSTNIKIIVEGITSTGVPVTAKTEYYVR